CTYSAALGARYDFQPARPVPAWDLGLAAFGRGVFIDLCVAHRERNGAYVRGPVGDPACAGARAPPCGVGWTCSRGGARTRNAAWNDRTRCPRARARPYIQSAC